MSIRVTYKQFPIPSNSLKVPYTVSVPVGIRRKLTSTDLENLVKQMKADMLFLSYRRFDFLVAQKVNIDSIIALYGNSSIFNQVLPIDYRDFIDNNNNLIITSASFDSLRRQFCQDFHSVIDVLISKNMEIISKSTIDSFSDNSTLFEIERLFDFSGRVFKWEDSLRYQIGDSIKNVDFTIQKKLNRHLSTNALRTIIRKQTKELKTTVNIFNREPAIMSFSIREDYLR